MKKFDKWLEEQELNLQEFIGIRNVLGNIGQAGQSFNDKLPTPLQQTVYQAPSLQQMGLTGISQNAPIAFTNAIQDRMYGKGEQRPSSFFTGGLERKEKGDKTDFNMKIDHVNYPTESAAKYQAVIELEKKLKKSGEIHTLDFYNGLVAKAIKYVQSAPYGREVARTYAKDYWMVPITIYLRGYWNPRLTDLRKYHTIAEVLKWYTPETAPKPAHAPIDASSMPKSSTHTLHTD